METDPAFVIQGIEHLINGGARVLVRKRGGRMVKLFVPAPAVNGPDIEALVAVVIDHQPPRLTQQGKV